MNNKRNVWRRLQDGLSMIEVLVSLTIVAFGLLGLLGLQARALSFQRDSFDRRTAAEMVAQLAERMRANHMGLVGGFYDRDAPSAPDLHATTPTPIAITSCAVATACTAEELAFRDWVQFETEYRRRTPNSAAYVDWNPADPRRVQVSVGWAEPLQGPAPVADAACDEITARLGVVIPPTFRCYTSAVFP